MQYTYEMGNFRPPDSIMKTRELFQLFWTNFGSIELILTKIILIFDTALVITKT